MTPSATFLFFFHKLIVGFVTLWSSGRDSEREGIKTDKILTINKVKEALKVHFKTLYLLSSWQNSGLEGIVPNLLPPFRS